MTEEKALKRADQRAVTRDYSEDKEAMLVLASALRHSREKVAALEHDLADCQRVKDKAYLVACDSDGRTKMAMDKVKVATGKLTAILEALEEVKREREDWEKRAEQAEASAATMREALIVLGKMVENHGHAECDHANNAPSEACQQEWIVRKALSSDAGKAHDAEVRAQVWEEAASIMRDGWGWNDGEMSMAEYLRSKAESARKSWRGSSAAGEGGEDGR